MGIDEPLKVAVQMAASIVVHKGLCASATMLRSRQRHKYLDKDTKIYTKIYTKI